jgi:hypothetical protein
MLASAYLIGKPNAGFEDAKKIHSRYCRNNKGYRHAAWDEMEHIWVKMTDMG